MWLQIELPEPATLVEIQLDSSAAGRANPGLGGFGGLGVTTPSTPAGTPVAPAGASPESSAAGRGTASARKETGRSGSRGAAPAASPAAYTVELSMDGTEWSTPVAEHTGQPPASIVTFHPTQAKFIRVTQKSAAAGSAVQQVRIYRVPPPPQ
jgi:hypothetical protein